MRRTRKIQFVSVAILLFVGMLFSPVQAKDLFSPYQAVPTSGAYDFEIFTIGSDTYLAVANHRSASSYNIDSKVYRWNGAAFVEVQAIPTSGAADFESFTIGDTTYLAVANYFNGSSYNLESKIYRKEAPTAKAGPDQIVYDAVLLDGSESVAIGGGWIVSWNWTLKHRTNPAYDRDASGEVVTLEDLAPGFYDVTLAVTDNEGLTGTDMALVAAAGRMGDFDADGDVDGGDLAAFAGNFGKTD